MKSDTSYGVVPLKNVGDIWYVFLIQHRNGAHWGFPKGHKVSSEEPLDAARRELEEETALLIKSYLHPEPIQESYSYVKEGEKILKTVYYFLVETVGNYSLQEEEILKGRWLTINEAEGLITFEESKNVLRKAHVLLQEKKT